jgi:hypothetical protein
MASQDAQMKASRSMGHIALHYQTPEDGPLAARLLSLLGFVETQDLTLPDGSHFYRFVVDPQHHARGDGIIYLSAVPEAQRKLVEAVRGALKVNTPEEHPAVGGMRAALQTDPEYSFHAGFLMESLEDLEQTVLRLKELAETDPELKGRIKITVNRAMRGTPEVDARLDASPLYGDVTRTAYGRNGVQAFVETDILSSGTLGENMVIEFDYVFPGYQSHVLSVVEMA